MTYDSLKGKISQIKVVEDFESRLDKAVSFVVEREKEIQEWNEQKLPKVLPCYSGGRLPGRSVKEKGREEREVDEGSGERTNRQDITQRLLLSRLLLSSFSVSVSLCLCLPSLSLSLFPTFSV